MAAGGMLVSDKRVDMRGVLDLRSPVVASDMACDDVLSIVSSSRVMRGLNGSRTLRRGRERRGSKRERAALGDCSRVETQGPGGLCDRQTLAIKAVADFAERLVVDHDRGSAGQDGAAAGPCDMARMSCPSRNNRSVVRTMSSCSGVPTRWAIKPMRTTGLCRYEIL
jgi:hypothetical protein